MQWASDKNEVFTHEQLKWQPAASDLNTTNRRKHTHMLCNVSITHSVPVLEGLRGSQYQPLILTHDIHILCPLLEALPWHQEE